MTLPDVPDSPADDWALQALADHAGDTVFQEFSADEWVAALQEARRNWGENTTEYLIAHPQLADYLLEGLNLLAYSCDV